jgi:hypothetical protein
MYARRLVMSDPVIWSCIILWKVKGYANVDALVASLPSSTSTMVKSVYLDNTPASHTTIVNMLKLFKSLESLDVLDGELDL